MVQTVFILVFLITSALPLVSGAEEIRKLNRLNIADFSAYFPVYNVLSNAHLTVPEQQKRVSTPVGTKNLWIHKLTDPNKVPYEDSKAEILVMEGSRPRWRLEIRGFKHLTADWVTEDVLKVEIWPGRAVQLFELINIETGQVLYRSADAHIFAPPPVQ